MIGDLQAAGLPIELDWFAPHFEFRFPLIGEIETSGVAIELRQALEPWHVLGEEGTAGGTARYVDNSLDRVQVMVRDGANGRFAVTCNRRGLPLTSTGTFGEAVAGVRYRTWACIGVAPDHSDPRAADVRHHRHVDGPLDRRLPLSRRPPGRPELDIVPINAYEAEGRRLARFEKLGHTPGPRRRPAQVNPDYPLTLDLAPGLMPGGHRRITGVFRGFARWCGAARSTSSFDTAARPARGAIGASPQNVQVMNLEARLPSGPRPGTA